MIDSYSDGDPETEMLERRWFAAFKAASEARAECETLVEELEMIELAWSRARTRLARLESLRDALGEELAELDGKPEGLVGRPIRLRVTSAA
jgi:hypothetical protein